MHEGHHSFLASNNSGISIANMVAPPGWSESFQKSEFEEYTYIISGKKQFIIEDETFVLEAEESTKTNTHTSTIR